MGPPLDGGGDVVDQLAGAVRPVLASMGPPLDGGGDVIEKSGSGLKTE